MARQTREHKHKKRIVRTLIFPTVLYGCETWTMTKKMEKKINACEMWIWRKMQRILWMEKKNNESVRMEIGIEEEETLQQTALRRKLGFFGHVMRSDGLEKGMMLAHEDGKRRRERPRRKWMDDIHEVTGMKLAELRDVTTERKQWRRLVKTVARAQRVDSTRLQGEDISVASCFLQWAQSKWVSILSYFTIPFLILPLLHHLALAYDSLLSYLI